MDVVICDDHPVVREGLRRLIEGSAVAGSVHEAGNAHELLDLLLVNAIPCDLVLLDLGLPGRGGLEVLRQLKRERPRLRVLVLSVHPANHYAIRALRAGAAGYLTKCIASEELIRAMETVGAGQRYLTSDVADRLAEDLERPPNRASHELLSDREFEILALLAAGQTMKAIAADLCLSYNTINTYRARILSKLGLSTTAELIRFALLQGLTD